MTKIISPNESALYLVERPRGQGISVDDAARLLTERKRSTTTAGARDAAAWAEKLRDRKLI